MLEVSNIKVRVAPLRKHPDKESKMGFDALLRALRVSADDVAWYELHKRSIDARKRNDIVLILTYYVSLKGGPTAEQNLLNKIQGKPAAKHIKPAKLDAFTLPKATQPAPSDNRPVRLRLQKPASIPCLLSVEMMQHEEPLQLNTTIKLVS